MREIKFRAWDNNRKSMVSIAEVNLEHDGSGKTVIGRMTYASNEHHTIVHGENGYLLQFTGLKDKNGKEIYEGDILSNTTAIVEFDENDVPVPTGEFRTNRRQVEWDAHWGSWKLTDDIERGELKVIGNIYENPELLPR